MYFVSPFTPIFFTPSTDTSGSGSSYTQIFSPSDEILLQVICRSESRTITGKIINMFSAEAPIDITWKVWSMNQSDKLLYHVITGLADGCYCVEINGIKSEPFRITSDKAELDKTTLIQYSMKDNKRRQDGIFWIGDTQFYFDWRVPGGFKDDNWTFGVENEQYTDSDNNMYDVYSAESTQKAFTLGDSCGCPIWFGEMLNRILSCTYVYFEGERFVRSGSSVPEMQKVMENRRSYVFKQILFDWKIVDYDESANIMKIRRVDDSTFRKVQNRILTV